MEKIVILGTGMAGFGASNHLHKAGIRPVVYDKNSYFGGHTASFRNEQGFLYDLGPHISFTKDERIQELFAGFVNSEYEALQVKLSNYWRGIRLTHPVQLHLHGLPHDLVTEIISEFVSEQSGEERPITNYEQWLVASFGRRFAELFPMQYTKKYHTTSADNLTTDWLGPRMYKPSLEEMIKGALGPWNPGIHYVSHFRYPTKNGFYSYQQGFPEIADLALNHKVVSIDPKTREIVFENGKKTGYDRLISSIPLPDLIPMIIDAPRDVLEASGRLACSTCVLVNVGVTRQDLSDSHMTYFYDEDICFSRLSFPHMLSATNVPQDCGSIQAEIYFSKKYRPLTTNPTDLIDTAVNDLRRSGILREEDKVLFSDTRLIRYANVIFDHDRPASLKTVHGFLNDVGIAYCGRYGDWDYMWTDQSYISGERAAEFVIQESAKPASIASATFPKPN